MIERDATLHWAKVGDWITWKSSTTGELSTDMVIEVGTVEGNRTRINYFIQGREYLRYIVIAEEIVLVNGLSILKPFHTKVTKHFFKDYILQKK